MSAWLGGASLSKSFGVVRAVDGATVAFERGRIHALCGENGAGKSTLLHLLCGRLAPDAGTVTVAGAPLVPHSAREAIARGVAMVSQHFSLIPAMTVLENVMLGSEPVGFGGVLEPKAARARALAAAGSLAQTLAWDVPVAELGVVERQWVEIVRALYRGASLLILDEPTAVLTRQESDALYATLRRLADEGSGIVVVTHHLDEVRRYADAVTVLRRGRTVRDFDASEVKRDGAAGDAFLRDLTKAMMGGELSAAVPAQAPTRAVPGESLLTLADVGAGRELEAIYLDLRAGEIVGVAGVEGNGQRALLDVLAGERAPDRGSMTGLGVGAVARIHEDRQTSGLVLDASVAENVVLGEMKAFARHGLVDDDALADEATRRLERVGAPVRLRDPARTLSGGNQQKVVVARALARGAAGARVLVAAQPTRGVDLSAARAIRADIAGAASQGMAVLVVSSDLAELRELSHRIVVLRKGRIVAEHGPDADDVTLGRDMLGSAEAGGGS